MAKLYVSGGGTGGHFFPAVALLETALEEGADALFVGAQRGIEHKLRDGIPSERLFIDALPFVGMSLPRKLKALFTLAKSSLWLYRRMEKDAKSVVFGGYASLPLGLASLLRGTDLFLHEQNSLPSLTNSLLSKFSKRVFITFESSRRYFPRDMVIRTGLPIRRKLLKGLSLDKRECRRALGLREDGLTLLVMGGSQGASFLNEVGMKVFGEMDLQGVHLTGERDYKRVKEFYDGKKLPVVVMSFTHDMELVYRASDLAISRAGASSITELSLYGVPAIFIPFPFSAKDHQYYNALEIQDMGGGIVIRQDEAELKILIESLEKLLSDLDAYSKNIRGFANPEAGKIILEHLLQEG